MFELGVQLAAGLKLWRAVRCSGPSKQCMCCAGGMVAVNKAPQSRWAGQNAATCSRKIETELGRAGMGRVATAN